MFKVNCISPSSPAFSLSLSLMLMYPQNTLFFLPHIYIHLTLLSYTFERIFNILLVLFSFFFLSTHNNVINYTNNWIVYHYWQQLQIYNKFTELCILEKKNRQLFEFFSSRFSKRLLNVWTLYHSKNVIIMEWC